MATATPDLKSKLEEVNEQIASVDTEAKEKWQAFEQAREQFAKAGEDANNTDSEAFKSAEAVHREYAEKADQKADLEQVRDGIFKMLSEERGERFAAERVPESTEVQEHAKSVKDRLDESKGYKELLESGRLNSERASFNAELMQTSVEEFKALIVGLSSPFITPQREAFVPQPRRPLKVIDLITTGQTNVDSVEYARQSAFTNVAAETAESTATTTGTKPEATIAFTKITAAVKNIAHWIPATRRALADIAQLQTLIESQLRYGVQLRLEDQIVNGDGTGENLTGILNTGSILTQAKGADSNEDALFKAITQIRLGFVEPNGIALHPNNWQTIRLNKASTAGTYLIGDPTQPNPDQLWGLPVAVTAAVPANTGLTGDFTQAILWVREGLQVLASDSHSDFFVKNLIALLAEMRAAFGVLLPAAFCKVTSMT